MLNHVLNKDKVPFDSGLLENELMSNLEKIKSPKEFDIKKIENTYANNFVFNHHYLKRKLYIARNVSYGLFCLEFCVGVVMYGFPVWRQMPGLCPPMTSAECPELLRLCTLSGLPKNTESYLVGKTLRLLRTDWEKETGVIPKSVTSLCDLAFGFNGSIYKATNFKFLREVEGRATNPGKTHGKWKKNDHNQKARKSVWVYWYV